MEEIYKETISETERFYEDGIWKQIIEDFTVYNEKVKKKHILMKKRHM